MLRRVQGVARIVFGAVQKVLGTALLVVLYVFIFGMTALFMRLFKRAWLPKACRRENACWHESSDHEVEGEGVLRQS